MFKLIIDKPNMTALVANATIGAKAFEYEENQTGEDNDFSDGLHYTSKKICDAYLFNDGIVELEEAEALALLTGLRASVELFLNAPLKTVLGVLVHQRVTPESMTPERRMQLGKCAHCVLDFMECHVPDKVVLKWIEERKETARDMMEFVAKVSEEDYEIH